MFKLGLLLALGIWFFAVAEQLDSASQEALQKTQDLMTSTSERAKFLEKDANARAADGKLDSLSSDPQVKEMSYKAGADIFGDLVKKNNGDVDKMKDALDKAMKDPEAFYKTLSPEQQAQIRDIAGKIQPPTSKP